MSKRSVHNFHSPPAALDGGVYEARLKREISARVAAEKIIEQKSDELYRSAQELENVLSGAVKILTDVLALARPEVFQKATKVQRWARRLAPKLEVERPWELDLAATLYPLGIIGLSDELALKYALDEPLDQKEKQQIDESTKTAFELIDHIPRMQGVAQAILYCRKGFDGSGYPVDGMGETIPQHARILKILIDLADASTGAGVSRADGFVAMASKKQEYDLDILKVAYIVLLEEENPEASFKRSLKVNATFLKPEDIVLRDIIDKDNRLLLAAGSQLSELNIKRLRSMAGEGHITGKFCVQRG